MTGDVFTANREALAARSPEAARAIGRPADAAAFRPALAANGEPIVEFEGRPLESRRAPADAARRLAESVAGGRVVLVGFGCGYLAEALLAAGREVAAVIESEPAAIAAAIAARDLTAVLSRVPVVLASQLDDPAELVLLKANAPTIVPLGARVSTDGQLARIVAAWPGIGPVGRRPRVLVVGPILGGSLETARSTARAFAAVGAEVRFTDFAPFAPGWSALETLSLPKDQCGVLQAALTDVLGQVVLREAASFKPDLVLALAQAPLARDVTDRLRGAGMRTAFWFVENWRVLPYWKDVAAGYDVFFAIQGGPFLERVRAAGAAKAVYLPTACDPSRHAPLALTPEERSRYGASVSFAGAPYLNRQRILAALADFGLRIWGEGWDRTELAHLARGTGHRFTLDEMVRVFAASAINLNVHSASHVDGLDPDPDYLNPRTFELAACGAFQLVDDRSPLGQAFGEDEVVSFRSIPELRDRVRYFLDRPQDREDHAKRALARAVGEHTFAHRVRAILSETLPPEMVAAALLPDTAERLRDVVGRMERSEPSMGAEEALLRILVQLEGQP